MLRSTEVDHHNCVLLLEPFDRGRLVLLGVRRGSGKRTEVRRRPSSEEDDTATRSLPCDPRVARSRSLHCDRSRCVIRDLIAAEATRGAPIGTPGPLVAEASWVDDRSRLVQPRLYIDRASVLDVVGR